MWLLETKTLVLAFLLIVGGLVWWLRRQSGVWLRRAEQPPGEWRDCSECDGMGMVKFPERRAFTAFERANYTLEQLKANGISCQYCGGQERVFIPD